MHPEFFSYAYTMHILHSFIWSPSMKTDVTFCCHSRNIQVERCWTWHHVSGIWSWVFEQIFRYDVGLLSLIMLGLLDKTQNGETNINLTQCLILGWLLLVDVFFIHSIEHGWDFLVIIVIQLVWLPPKLPVANVRLFQATWNAVFLDFKLLYKLTLPCGCQNLGEKKQLGAKNTRSNWTDPYQQTPIGIGCPLLNRV